MWNPYLMTQPGMQQPGMAPPAAAGAAGGGFATAFQDPKILAAMQFANALGGLMASQGGNQVGAGLGQFNAQNFQNMAGQRTATQGFGQGQAQQPPQQPQMAQQTPQPQMGAPGQPNYGNAFLQPQQASGLAQTQIGAAPPINPTMPSAGPAFSGLVGGNTLFDSMNFNPDVWSRSVR